MCVLFSIKINLSLKPKEATDWRGWPSSPGIDEERTMTIESSDIDCPDCGTGLQVIYVTELKQSVSGWACPNCGYVASKRDQFEDSVDVSEKELLMRVEKPLSRRDVRDSLSDIESEFRARAANMDDDELWLLIDPETEEVVDAVVGDDVSE